MASHTFHECSPSTIQLSRNNSRWPSMQFFDEHVQLNLAAYEGAEAGLSRAALTFPINSPEYEAAAGQAMVAAMNIATAAHQLADHIFQQSHLTRPATVYWTKSVQEYREYLDGNKCVYIGVGQAVQDVSLLGCVADAYTLTCAIRAGRSHQQKRS